jgi:hypothetical protein
LEKDLKGKSIDDMTPDEKKRFGELVSKMMKTKEGK